MDKVTVTTADHDTIYLQPLELVEWDGDGRQWCEDDVWEDEGHSGIRYVRADQAEEQIKLLRGLVEEAFLEGYALGGTPRDANRSWEQSDSRQALEVTNG